MIPRYILLDSEFMLWYHFFMPNNPVQQARLHAGQSLHEFAQSCGVSRVAVQRTESGCYIAVPPAIIDRLLSLLFITPEGVPLTTDVEIQTAYSEFQKQTRRETYLAGRLTLDLPDFPVGVSPVYYWRLMSGVASQLEFCKLLCLHPYTIEKTENGVQQKLPKQLLAALREAGYDDTLIHELDRRQRLYAEG